MVENERYYLDEYIWKATGIMAGIYMFYLVEKVLRHILNWWQVSWPDVTNVILK